MSYRVFLFDFDGTIANTMGPAYEILNDLADQYGFRRLEPSEVEIARDMTTRELMRHLEVPMRRLPSLARRGSQALRSRIAEVEPIEGVPDAIRQLKAMGAILAIVTSNSAENVNAFLDRHDLNLFDHIRTSSRLFGKARDIRSIRKLGKFEKSEMLFVGDETRDIEASRKAGIHSAAVLWGYNSRKALCSCDPEHVLEKPEDLPKMFTPREEEQPRPGRRADA